MWPSAGTPTHAHTPHSVSATSTTWNGSGPPPTPSGTRAAGHTSASAAMFASEASTSASTSPGGASAGGSPGAAAHTTSARDATAGSSTRQRGTSRPVMQKFQNIVRLTTAAAKGSAGVAGRKGVPPIATVATVAAAAREAAGIPTPGGIAGGRVDRDGRATSPSGTSVVSTASQASGPFGPRTGAAGGPMSAHAQHAVGDVAGALSPPALLSPPSMYGGTYPASSPGSASLPASSPTGIAFRRSPSSATLAHASSGGGPAGSSDLQLARGQALAAISANKAALKPSNVLVGVRSRPLNDSELASGDEDMWTYEPEAGVLYEKRGSEGSAAMPVKQHVYDCVFPPDTRTSAVYEAMGVPIVSAALEGYNGTLFAYGQTGSGKTYTLMGTAEEPGMTILAVHDVFKKIEEARDEEFLVRVSYIELYQEDIRDLFNPDAGALRIVDNPITGPYVKGLTEEVVLSPERVLELMAIGEANRHVAATFMNMNSSRSHTLFKMVIESRKVDTASGKGGTPGLADVATLAAAAAAASTSALPTPRDRPVSRGGFRVDDASASGSHALVRSVSSASMGAASVTQPINVPISLTNVANAVVRVASLHLVDLAGSERVSKTGAAGTQLKESGVINSSLLTLGVVINKLISGDQHIPYRDSKLTRLLSTSLGGNAKTAVVVNMSPAGSNLGETRSSLQFAARAMKIVNRARVNEVADESALISQYKREIAQLKAALLEGRGGMIITADGEVVSAEEMLERMKRQHEDRQRAMEEQLRVQQDGRSEVTQQLTDLVQLCFVAAHACGHIRSSPQVLQVLADVAAGRCTPPEAVRDVVNSVPGFRKRMTRLLKSQHIRALSGSALAADILESGSGGPQQSPPGSVRSLVTSSSFGPTDLASTSTSPASGLPARRVGSSPALARLPSAGSLPDKAAGAAQSTNALAAKASLAASSIEWSATGASASAVRLSTVAEEDAASTTSGRRSLSPPASWDHDAPATTSLVLFPRDSTMTFGASDGELHEGESADGSPSRSDRDAEYAVDYFSPQSFARQLKSLMGSKDILSRRVKELTEALVAKTEEAAAANVDARTSADALKNVETAYQELSARMAVAQEKAGNDFATIAGLRDEIGALRSTLAEHETNQGIMKRDVESLQRNAEAAAAQAAESVALLESQLTEESRAREQAEAEVRAHDRRAREVEHARSLLEREVAQLKQQLAREHARAEEATSENSRLKSELEAKTSRCAAVEDEVATAVRVSEGLRERLGMLEKDAYRQAHELASTAAGLADVTRQRDESRTEAASLRTRALEAESHVAELRSSLESISSQHKDLLARFAALQSAHAIIAAERDGLQHSLDSSTASETQLGRDVATLRRALVNRDAELAAASRAADELEREVAALKRMLNESDMRTKDLEARLSDATQEAQFTREQLAQRDTEVAGLSTRVETKRVQVDELQRSVDEMKVRLATAMASLDQRGQRIVDLEADLRALRAGAAAERDQSSTECEELRTRISALETELLARATANEENATRLRQAHEGWNEVKALAAQRETELSDARRQLREKASKLATEEVAARAAHEKLQLALRAESSAKEEVSTRLHSTAAQLQAEHERAQQLEERAHELESRLMHITDAREGALELLQQRENDLAQIRAELNAASDRFSAKSVALQEKEQQLQSQVALVDALHQKLRQAEHRAVVSSDSAIKAAEELQSRTSENDDLRQQIQGLVAQVADLTGDLSAARSQASDAESKLVTLQAEAAALASNFQQEQRRASNAETRLASVDTELQRLREHSRTLASALEKATAARDAADTKAARLAAEATAASEELDHTKADLLNMTLTLRSEQDGRAAAVSAADAASRALVESQREAQQLSARCDQLHAQIQAAQRAADAAAQKHRDALQNVLAAETQRQDLATQLEEVRAQRDVAEAENHALQQELTTANATLSQLAGEAGDLRTSCKSVSTERDGLRERLSSAHSRIASLETSLLAAERKCSDLQQTVAASARLREEDQARAERAETALQLSSHKLDQTNDELRAASHAVSRLNAALEEAQAALTVVTAARHAADSALASLRAEQDVLRDELSTVRSELEHRYTLMQEAEGRSRQLAADLLLAQTRAQDGEARASALSARLAGAEGDASAFQSRVSALTGELTQVRAECERLSTHLATVTASRDAAIARGNDLEARVSASTAASKASAAEVMSLRSDVARLHQDLSTTSHARDVLLDRVKELDQQVSSLGQQMEDLREYASSLERANADSHAEASSSASELHALRRTHAELVGKAGHLAADVEAATARIAILQAAVTKRDEDLVSQQQNLAEASARANRLQSDLELAVQVRSSLEQAIAQGAGREEALQRELQAAHSELAHSRRSCMALEQRVSDSQSALTRLRSEHESELVRSQAISHELQQLRTAVDNQRAQLETVLAEAATARRDLAESRAAREEAERARESAQRTAAGLRDDLDAQVDAATAAKDRAAALHQSIARLEDERDSALADARYAQGELDAARERTLMLQRELADIRAQLVNARDELAATKGEASRAVRQAISASISTFKDELRSVRSTLQMPAGTVTPRLVNDAAPSSPRGGFAFAALKLPVNRRASLGADSLATADVDDIRSIYVAPGDVAGTSISDSAVLPDSVESTESSTPPPREVRGAAVHHLTRHADELARLANRPTPLESRYPGSPSVGVSQERAGLAAGTAPGSWTGSSSRFTGIASPHADDSLSPTHSTFPRSPPKASANRRAVSPLAPLLAASSARVHAAIATAMSPNSNSVVAPDTRSFRISH